jgi:hypothetical protein
LAHLYYTTLGNKSYCTPGDANCNVAQPGWGLTNTGNFQNLQSIVYWSGTEYAPDTNFAWFFVTDGGGQDGYVKSYALYAVAVRPGDVTAAIPEPETYALMLVGLTAMLVVRRRRAVGASAL